MKDVAKYNLYKGVSTILTAGTPIATMLACGESFLKDNRSSVSAAGIVMIIFMLSLFKDKIAENFKVPPVCVIAAGLFIAITLVETILGPIKVMCLTTAVAGVADKFTFDRWYHIIESRLPETAKLYKNFGFIFTTTDNLKGE